MRIGIEARLVFRQDKNASDQLALDLIHGLMAIDDYNEYYIFVAPGPDNTCIHDAPNFHVVELKAWSSMVWEQIVLPREVDRYGLDLLHCTSTIGLARTSTPTILTIEDTDQWSRPRLKEGIFQRLRLAYQRRSARGAVHRSWGVVTTCHNSKRLLERWDRQVAKKTRVIHKGVSSHFLYEPFQAAPPEQLPKQYILYFGGTSPRKNMRNTLKGYELYTKMTTREVLPLVVADVSGDQLNQTLKEMGILGLRDNIRLIGPVPKTLLPSLYRHATLLLSPMLRDTTGNPIIEAMACGTVVLTSDTPCLTELAGNAGFLVNPFSAEEISHGIFKILHVKEVRQGLLDSGRERVKQFLWPLVARRYQSLYLEMISDQVQLPFSSEDLIPS
ncbi:MAG: glycosyltransferase family 1 protein [Bacteroidota bacterium]